MPTLMPRDTREALGQNAERCDSRSLLLDRFCDPTAKEDDRKQVFVCAMGKSAISKKVEGWSAWLSQANPGMLTLYTQLQSRLMVNMAGGVMENAGLCLDRFGMPYIPGSAVKGCARRAALAALHDWCSAGGQPMHKPTGPADPLAACCAPFATPAQMLAAIALVFGWCEQDWSAPSDQSDFRWACANNEALLKTAAETLAARFHWEIDQRRQNTPRLSLPNFAGLISFLPAYPVDLGKTGKVDGLPCEVPALGKLELDVVTCHHRDYYEGKLPVATDTEDPNPVVFPAVAPGHVFAFALLPMPRGGLIGLQFQLEQSQFNLLELAKNWLATGLSVFGLGAKTNAGYGWFTCSDAVQTTATKLIEEKERRDREDREREEAERKRKQEELKRIQQNKEREEVLAKLSDDERADKEIELLTPQQFDAKVRAFCKESRRGGPTEDQKKAIVRALRGPRLDYWNEFKNKATRGELARVAQAIRELSRKMYPGNEGKMP